MIWYTAPYTASRRAASNINWNSPRRSSSQRAVPAPSSAPSEAPAAISGNSRSPWVRW
jgi:hypothetical protein